VTEHEHYENVLRFQRFEGIIRFLESSLYYVDPPENGDSSVEGRLRAVIEAMSKKEQKYQEIEAMNAKVYCAALFSAMNKMQETGYI